ncbi:hypothetical protein BLA9940_02621 [Burkholderia aenigmatica]|uniref:hypothetical protein n=1 Tax=Burkholderia cepacia complex TaxID=87882 RepID=UPI0013DE19B8|nr:MULTISPECIES: hypothetical protein [Burkholderia cepacia complex]VWC57611.1 hypothetical protein BLA9940_02621 [Burkholderia aenigmatica]
MRTVLVPVRLFSLAATSCACNFRLRAAAAPGLVHPKRLKSNGLSFALPANWRVTANDPLEDTDGRGGSIQADKAAFEGLNLDVVVQVLRTTIAPSFDCAAQSLGTSGK